jgi:hypothetical protein
VQAVCSCCGSGDGGASPTAPLPQAYPQHGLQPADGIGQLAVPYQAINEPCLAARNRRHAGAGGLTGLLGPTAAFSLPTTMPGCR